MDPQRVQCRNCGGKLAVRSEKFLGKVVACPRCSQPVQIPLTFDAINSNAQLADSQALTSVDLEALRSSLPDATANQGNTPISGFDDDFDGVDAALAAASVTTPAPEPATPTDNDLFGDSFQSALESTPAPIAAAVTTVQEPATDPDAHRRKLYLWSGLAVCICVLSITLLALFLRSMGSGTKLANAEDLKAAKPNEAIVAPVANNANPKPVDPVAQPDNAAVTKSDATGPVDTPAKESKDESTTPVTAPEQTDVVEAPVATALPLMPPTSTDALLEVIGGHKKLDLSVTPKPGEQTAPAAEISQDIPEEFMKNAKLFDPGSMTLLPDAKTLKPDEVEGGEAYARQSEIGVLYHPDPAPVPNWDTVRGTPVIKLTIPELPLLEIITTLESTFGAPCSWDIQGLAFENIDFNKRIARKYENTTLEAVYQDVLGEYGLVVKPQGEALPRIVAGPQMLGNVDQDVALDDLVTATTSGEAWLNFFQAMFPEASSQLSLQGTHIRFADAMNRLQRQQLSALVAQIRAASHSYASGGQQLTAIHSRELDRTLQALVKTGSSSFAVRKPTVMALTSAAQEFDLPLMVDWESCWQHGLTPQASSTMFTKYRSFFQISRFAVDQYALTIVVDPLGRLVMTTPPMQRQLVQHHVITLNDPMTIETLRQAILPLWPKGSDGRSTLRVQLLPGDQKPQMAVVRVCAPSLVQLSDPSIVAALSSQPETN